MKIAITGGTGLIGSKLSQQLVNQHHDVLILTRDASNKQNTDHLTYVEWLSDHSTPEKELEGTDVFVNFAGESLMGRWTKSKKKAILDSRVTATRELLSIIHKLEKKPEALINASAIGYYGNSQTEEFTEESEPIEENFLSYVTQKWEQEAASLMELGVRIVYGRIGIVLDSKEGALPKMTLPYRLFVGGTVASGKQWMSWIHIDDVVGLFQHAVENKEITGPLNITAPKPVRMKELNQEIGEELGRPHWMPAPQFAIKLALGEMSTLVVDGAYVSPRKAFDSDYSYHYTEIKPALHQLLT
ncbi:TIGR01777 family oxidoreductase [Shouchella shacheensis]|uniref:TIGR01777 family oxidoreductase n=1 Tax=Shouchella shacheensis TaxID=1649580 RepID=UPI00073FC1FE|nr:TIGR01777 family oxidoreductase [Shouchella shacheensis]